MPQAIRARVETPPPLRAMPKCPPREFEEGFPYTRYRSEEISPGDTLHNVLFVQYLFHVCELDPLRASHKAVQGGGKDHLWGPGHPSQLEARIPSGGSAKHEGATRFRKIVTPV